MTPQRELSGYTRGKNFVSRSANDSIGRRIFLPRLLLVLFLSHSQSSQHDYAQGSFKEIQKIPATEPAGQAMAVKDDRNATAMAEHGSERWKPESG
jgi:hypothetical protein